MLLLSILIIYILLALLLPKGLLIQELLQLPIYWIGMQSVSTQNRLMQKYAYGPHARQYLLYAPSSQVKKRPYSILYIHGGGWRFGSPEAFKAHALFLNDLGFDVFLLSHRKLPKHNALDMKEDCLNALLKVGQILKSKQQEEHKIILGGLSSGANLVALLLYNSKSLNEKTWSIDHFAGIFLLAAPLQLRYMSYSPVLWQFAGKKSSNLFLQANPYDQIPANGTVPHLILHGDKDGLVPHRSTQSFAKALKERYPDLVEFHLIKGATHLDLGKWSFREDQTAHLLRNWLERFY